MEFVRRLDDCPEARKDLTQASIVGMRGKGPRRLRLGAATGDPAIPPGSSVEFEGARVNAVKPGSLVLVRVEAEVLVRRLQAVSPGASGLQMRVTSPSGASESRTLPGSALVGRVLRLEHEGRDLRVGGGPLTWLTSVLRRFF